MQNFQKKLSIFLAALFLFANLHITSFASEAQKSKFPDYAYEFVGNDKFENFNRKMFQFNLKLNKYAIRPVHILWASVMPKYGMERIQSAYTNIIYPRRLVSSLIQRDFKTAGHETVRFLTNTTIGLGGMYDPAKKLLKIEPSTENMEQALAKCKCKQGPYLVVPVLSGSSPRGLLGGLLDAALDPSCYIGTPVLAMVKAGILVNRTSYIQPLTKMLEDTYADPYDVAKKLYGLENYIKCKNLDRMSFLQTNISLADENTLAQAIKDVNTQSEQLINVSSAQDAANKEDKLAVNDLLRGGASTEDIILQEELHPDIRLDDYNPQHPVIDAMRTALFELPGIHDSIWSEFSLWNRSFARRIKTGYVNIDPEREDYKYRFILQKDKNAPAAIIFPSIGEGVNTHHSVVMAKLFYDEGYSVIIESSPFNWEFMKSMPAEYRPGRPANDSDYLKLVTGKVINTLEKKYDCKFKDKIVIGTSFGAITALFLADKEAQNNTLNISKYISINPPVELLYAMNELDKNNESWKTAGEELKKRVAVAAAKVIQVLNMDEESPQKRIETFAFTPDEARIITGFVLHQKLSDLIFTIENAPKNKKSEIYKMVNNMNYRDYAKKYLLGEDIKTLEDLDYETSLHSIVPYLKENDNYKIYHTLDDYLVNTHQLRQLKKYSGEKSLFFSNGSHLGYLYRPEFIKDLREEISLKPKNVMKETETIGCK